MGEHSGGGRLTMATSKNNPAGLGPSENTKELLAAMAALRERLQAEQARDRARDALVTWLRQHPALRPEDLRAVARQMVARKKGEAPVKSLNAKLSAVSSKPAVGKLGKAIREARVKAGLSAEALGERLGTSGATVGLWERKGKVPLPKFHAALHRALKLPKGVLPNGDARPAT